MDLGKLEQILDDKGIGDPAMVELLDATVPDFREDVYEAENEDDPIVYLVGIASLFHDGAGAYELLRKMRGVLESQGPDRLPMLYNEQFNVWRQRRDKSQHDLQYLRIVLGIKQSPEEIANPAAGLDEIKNDPFFHDDPDAEAVD